MSERCDGEFLWLEELDGADATAWVRDRNAETLAGLTGGGALDARCAELRAVLDSADRIPEITWCGGFVYNLWRDSGHPRGLWRRTTLAEYRRAKPDWQPLLDLDALAEAEGESWTWAGAELLAPGCERALVRLSRGGADAVVVREFDLVTRAFVPDGFILPEAKSSVCWIDRDRIWVATDFGPGSLTSAGLPRTVRRWRRGTPLHAAETVFEGGYDDVSVSATHDPTPGFTRSFVHRFRDFFHSQTWLCAPEGELIRIEVPEDAVVDLHRQWLLVRLRSDWTVPAPHAPGGEVTHPAGAVLVTRLDDFIAGAREMTPLFTPDERTTFDHHAWTRDWLILATLVDVRSRLTAYQHGAQGWRGTTLVDGRELEYAAIRDTDPLEGEGYLLARTSFLRPTALYHGILRDNPVPGAAGAGAFGAGEPIKREPAFFDASGMSVRQHFAVSADGTRVPYFLVSPAGGGDPAAGPTLLTGYGGFEISHTPAYSGIIGRGWLARGGSYAVANIRGGGEYGPRWHRAALRADRPRAYEDFAAIAVDLVRRGVTTPARLGITGGSNGGLLMGVMLTRYPELFGAVAAQAPLLDMRRYHRLLTGPAWMAEYGDPDDPADWEFLRAYSPYHNIRPDRAYPPALFVASRRDDRVHPGHARRMVARLRAAGHPAWYHESVEGGHSGAADNAQMAAKWAMLLEFLWQRLTA
jgi:prolyl oligopeptidase